MAFFQKNQQIQLSDGKMYLSVGTISVEGHEYVFLSPKDEDYFVVGEVKEVDGKQSFNVIKDEKIVQKIQDYYLEHQESLV